MVSSMIKTPESLSSLSRTSGLTNRHSFGESNSCSERKRVILSWLTAPPVIFERPVAVV